MGRKKKKKEETPLPSPQDALLLMNTLLGTTWRLFVPTLGGTLFGLWLDHTFSTKPFATLTGVICGILVAVYLVRKQLKGVM